MTEPDGIQMAKRIIRRDELVSKLPVNKANFLYIAETGKINGSLHQSICDLLLQETHILSSNLNHAEKEINRLKSALKDIELFANDTNEDSAKSMYRDLMHIIKIIENCKK
jgi:hypothetical protein